MLDSTAGARPSRSRRFATLLARDGEMVRKAQALRYQVFAGEMGARLHSLVPGLDCDEYDAYCDHLVVVDQVSDRVIGCTRLLRDAEARRLGRFYSQSEFELDRLLARPGRFLEIGRTCVAPGYRGGVIIAALWAELADYATQRGFDYLMGCASIPPGPSGFAVDAVYSQLSPAQLGPAELGVRSRLPVPAQQRCQRDESGIPPLLQAYLRLGAWVCGDPCWDPDFNVMDVFVLLSLDRLAERYERRFVGVKEAEHATISAMV
ncbi:GNAT family N-acetyltransferase [Methylolobus aquaticus]